MMYLRGHKYPPNGSAFIVWFALLCAAVWAWLCAELILRF